MLQKIHLEWVLERAETYTAMLGVHQVARVYRGDGSRVWAWFVCQCDGSGSSRCQYAINLEQSKQAVEAAIEQWFYQAGLLTKEPPQ